MSHVAVNPEGMPSGRYFLPNDLEVDGQVNLTLKKPDDGAETFALVEANRIHLGNHLLWVVDFSELRARQMAQFTLPSMVKSGSLAPYNIGYKGTYVGEIDLNRCSTVHAQLGYWIAESAQGKGIATRASERLVEFGFNDWGLNSIELLIDPTNERSRAVASRLGANIVEHVGQGSLMEHEIWMLEK